MGTGSLWGSLQRVDMAEGLWAPGARCACVTLPQCAPPANTFPTAAAATSQPVRRLKIACCRVGSHTPQPWLSVCLGPHCWWHPLDFCVSLRNFSRFQCLQGADTGAKIVVLVPEWPLGIYCDTSTPASGSSQAPTGGFFFPCEAQIDSCRSQK